MNASATALIIGGGVIGLSTAYQLARKQFGRIILLEREQCGAGSSSRAAGIITSLLWSETGVRARLLSLDLFRELSEELPGYRFHAAGCLNLFDPPTWPERAALLPLYDRLGAPYEILSAQEIRTRWPALTPSAETIGLHDPLGGYSEPEAYIPALAARVRDLGVELREGVAVTGFLTNSGRVTGVRTTQGEIGADVVICTAHAWTHHLLAELGVTVAMKAFVHQRYVTAPMSAPVDIPAVNANPQGGYMRPESGNRLLAGAESAERTEYRIESPSFQMTDLDAPAQLRQELAARLTPMVSVLAHTRWESEKVGLICFSIDGEPVLGPLSGVPGLYIGCAFHSGGFAYNPVAGLLLAELIAEGKSRINVDDFSPDRFDVDTTAEYLAATVPQSAAVRRRH